MHIFSESGIIIPSILSFSPIIFRATCVLDDFVSFENYCILLKGYSRFCSEIFCSFISFLQKCFRSYSQTMALFDSNYSILFSTNMEHHTERSVVALFMSIRSIWWSKYHLLHPRMFLALNRSYRSHELLFLHLTFHQYGLSRRKCLWLFFSF